jgi:uncharacterized protein
MTQEARSRLVGEDAVLPTAWWADEMLGRLARYLRFVGLDTAYETGLPDDEVVRRSGAEGRTLLTRDRALARQVPGAVLLTHVDLEGQWRELARRFPGLPTAPRFDRCTVCNGSLVAAPPDERGRPTFRCTRCDHRYWDGSHTAHIRATLERWAAERP